MTKIHAEILIIILLNLFQMGRSYKIILYLANVASDNSNIELQQSLKSLHSVFLTRQSEIYPVFIAYDKNDQEYLTPRLRTLLAAQINATQTQLIDPSRLLENTVSFFPVVTFRKIPWPFSMYTDISREARQYYSRLGYRLMCRFWAHTVFSQSFMRNVTSYLRLDTDTYLHHMPVNPINILETEGIAYLSSVAYLELPLNTDGLWETFLRFAYNEGIHPWGLVPLSNDGVDSLSVRDIQRMSIRDAVDVLYKRGYNLVYFYNNWEVSRVDIWKSPVYQRLASYIDAAGGIILRRWGDAPIRTLSLHLLHEQLAAVAGSPQGRLFRQYQGLAVHHKILHKTAGSEV
jgi:hypothetical protein